MCLASFWDPNRHKHVCGWECFTAFLPLLALRAHVHMRTHDNGLHMPRIQIQGRSTCVQDTRVFPRGIGQTEEVDQVAEKQEKQDSAKTEAGVSFPPANLND